MAHFGVAPQPESESVALIRPRFASPAHKYHEQQRHDNDEGENYKSCACGHQWSIGRRRRVMRRRSRIPCVAWGSRMKEIIAKQALKL